MRTIEQYYSNPVSARLYEVAYAQMVNLLFWVFLQQLILYSFLVTCTPGSHRRCLSMMPLM